MVKLLTGICTKSCTVLSAPQTFFIQETKLNILHPFLPGKQVLESFLRYLPTHDFSDCSGRVGSIILCIWRSVFQISTRRLAIPPGLHALYQDTQTDSRMCSLGHDIFIPNFSLFNQSEVLKASLNNKLLVTGLSWN